MNARPGGASPDTGVAWVTRARERLLQLVDTVPVGRRVMSELARVEFIDRMVVVAAQSLFALVPLIVVAAAFAPQAVRDGLVDQVGGLMSIGKGELAPVQEALSAERVRAQTGLVGIVVVLVSATSFARSLQRLFERVWQRPHRGGIAGVRRSVLWLVGCVVYLQVMALLLSALAGFPGSSLLRLAGQVTASTLLWWWSAHVLLQGRVPWAKLWPTAVLTASAMAVVTRGSQVVMPPYVRGQVEQFGLMGLVFAASTWLLVFGGVVVGSSVLGRVLVEDPRMQRSLDLVRGMGSRLLRTGAGRSPGSGDPRRRLARDAGGERRERGGRSPS